jgi:hypothetical protein
MHEPKVETSGTKTSNSGQKIKPEGEQNRREAAKS